MQFVCCVLHFLKELSVVIFYFEPELSAQPRPKLHCIQDQDKVLVKPVSVDAQLWHSVA